MKSKNKILALVKIVVVLCSMLLVALPVIAAEQSTQEISTSEFTTASKDDFVLGVYGNANEDDTIDMRDLTYVKLIFFGKKPETELADAKYDGKINPLDFIQIKLIIVGKEKELTIVDSADRIVTVGMPVERIVTFTGEPVEAIRSLKATDKIVGVDKYTIADNIFFPEFSDYPNVGWVMSPDIEKAVSLRPDVVFLYAAYEYPEIQNNLESTGATVIRFDFFRPISYIEEIKKLGYILKKEEEAGKFIDFHEGWLNTIKSEIEEIPEEKKPRVYFEVWKPYRVAGVGTVWHESLVAAGGLNIFSDITGYPEIDKEEVIMRNPEVIVRDAGWSKGGYGTDDITVFEDIRNEILNRPELVNVKAVKNERVYILAADILDGPRALTGIGYMAKWSYPELFKDLDPQAIHQEYLTEFQRLDYDLDEHGVFVYPLLEES